MRNKTVRVQMLVAGLQQQRHSDNLTMDGSVSLSHAMFSVPVTCCYRWLYALVHSHPSKITPCNTSWNKFVRHSSARQRQKGRFMHMQSDICCACHFNQNCADVHCINLSVVSCIVQAERLQQLCWADSHNLTEYNIAHNSSCTTVRL